MSADIRGSLNRTAPRQAMQVDKSNQELVSWRQCVPRKANLLRISIGRVSVDRAMPCMSNAVRTVPKTDGTASTIATAAPGPPRSVYLYPHWQICGRGCSVRQSRYTNDTCLPLHGEST
eukprot:GHVU01118918.1.p1 GENE.GHVU01118918.1~~GHVU01118918.1.p1  ORF type:complete len:119 (+),score=0.13 GHVU01118918.1:147-503(+)